MRLLHLCDLWVLGMNFVDNSVCHSVKSLYIPDRIFKATLKTLNSFHALTRMWHCFLHLWSHMFSAHQPFVHVLLCSSFVSPPNEVVSNFWFSLLSNLEIMQFFITWYKFLWLYYLDSRPNVLGFYFVSVYFSPLWLSFSQLFWNTS